MARVEEKARATRAETKLFWFADQIFRCAGEEVGNGPAPAFARLPRPQRDLATLRAFMMEALNGGVHQFFYNSSGDLAPELHEIPTRLGLPEHAQAIAEGMALFGPRSPREPGPRREVMAGFPEQDDLFLHELTYIADDGAILDAMAGGAVSSGLMPELQDAP